jgi:hypothetical protein
VRDEEEDHGPLPFPCFVPRGYHALEHLDVELSVLATRLRWRLQTIDNAIYGLRKATWWKHVAPWPTEGCMVHASTNAVYLRRTSYPQCLEKGAPKLRASYGLSSTDLRSPISYLIVRTEH